MTPKAHDELAVYQTQDQLIQLNVKIENETVWLTQAQMVVLFQSTKQNISLHVNNVFNEKELNYPATVKEYLTVRKEGKRDVRRIVKYYNLDVIISVGYRVKSQRGTQFRIWANSVLKEYLLKGYVVDYHLNNSVQKSIILMDNYIDETVLLLLSKMEINENILLPKI